METGLTFTSKAVVKKENTAITMGSGDMEVFATPAMVALMENAASDEAGVVGEGTHIRYIVDRERFLSKLNK